MGYRSDVTIIMYPSIGNADKFALLKLYVDENLPDKFEVIGEGDKRYLHFFIGGVKWYPGYEEVDVYTRAFSKWDTMFEDEYEPEQGSIFHYEFVRFGEDYEDIVYDRSVDSDMILNIERRAYVSI